MRYGLGIFLALALLLAACTQNAQPGAQNTQPGAQNPPEQPAAPTPTETGSNTAHVPNESAKPVVTGSDRVFGEVNRTAALNASEIKCDPGTRTVTFTLRNDDTRTWEMDQQLGWNPSKDKVNIHVSINSYEVNARNQYIDNGIKYFGPNWPFSANCGGVKELAPGSAATCTLQPVPLKNATSLTGGLNEIFIKTPTSDRIVQFTCG
jgi:hypothetical protein